jgi:hypothetical protein
MTGMMTPEGQVLVRRGEGRAYRAEDPHDDPRGDKSGYDPKKRRGTGPQKNR